MKIKFWYGLFGVSSDGILYTPSGKRIIKMRPSIAFKLHTLLNKYSFTGQANTKLLFRGN